METKKETEEDPLFPKPKKAQLPEKKKQKREDEQDSSSGKNGCHDKAGTLPETYKE